MDLDGFGNQSDFGVTNPIDLVDLSLFVVMTNPMDLSDAIDGFVRRIQSIWMDLSFKE